MEMKVGLTFACMKLKKLAKIKAKWGLLEGRNRKISSFFPFYITTKSEIFQEYHSSMTRSIMMQQSGKEGGIMEEKDWIKLFSAQNQIQKVMEMNRQTERFGLSLTQEEARLLVENRNQVLKEQQRVEFGEGILPKLIFAFCDSAYIDRENYVETMARLQEIFYTFKNETLDEITDDELLEFMREQFEEKCCGDTEYLEGTFLSDFAQAIRSGKRGDGE